MQYNNNSIFAVCQLLGISRVMEWLLFFLRSLFSPFIPVNVSEVTLRGWGHWRASGWELVGTNHMIRWLEISAPPNPLPPHPAPLPLGKRIGDENWVQAPSTNDLINHAYIMKLPLKPFEQPGLGSVWVDEPINTEMQGRLHTWFQPHTLPYSFIPFGCSWVSIIYN